MNIYGNSFFNYVFVHYVSSELFSYFSISYKRTKVRSLPVIDAYHRKS